MPLMRFYAAGKPREWAIADAVGHAARNAGYDFERVATEGYTRPDPNVDVACIWGVKRPSHRFMSNHHHAGIKTLFFDKGYTRRPRDKADRYRVSANAFQPTRYIMKWKQPPDRFRATGVLFHSWQATLDSAHVLIAGSSQKAHDWFPRVQPRDATAYYASLVRNLRAFTQRDIVYRPKPSWRGAEPVEGTRYSTKPRTLEGDLDFAHCVVVTCSGASFHALAAGIPVYVMPGFDNIATPIAGVSLKEIDWTPRIAPDDERYRWCCNVAYCEWSLDELRAGQWLELLREELA